MESSFLELVRAAQRGEVAAFERLVVRFQDRAVGLAFARLGDRGLAEDAAQEAFLCAYRCLKQLREPAAFPAWLQRIVLKQVDRITRVKQPSALSAPAMSSASSASSAWAMAAPSSASAMSSAPTLQGDVAEPSVDPCQELAARERSRHVLAEVLALPEALRTCVVLFYAGGHTIEEIAEFLEEPAGTIKRRLFDARAKLQERIVDTIQESMHPLRSSADEGFVARVSALLRALSQGETAEVARLAAAEPALIHAAGAHPIWGGAPHPLQVAAELGNTALVAVLLDQGAQPDVRPAAYDWSPLELAIHNGRRETAALLVERGASIELWSAAALGDVARIVELARREPVSVNARGPNGTPALGFAASIAAVDALLAAGADALAPDVNGNLPHQVLVGYPERREAARYLLARTGLPVELSFLCADGDLEGIERALQESPEAIERYGRPYDGAARLSRGALPLHVAVLHGQLSVASWLLDRGARVDARTRDGQTALHLAAGAGELALAELLLERGADPHAVETQHGSTPLGWAEFHHARLNGPDSCLAVAALLRARMVD